MSDHPDLPIPDDALVARLRALAGRHDAPPPWLEEAARAAFGWRTIDAELAAIVADSALDQDLALVRSDEDVRMLSFAAGDRVVEVEVSPSAGGRRLYGQVLPPPGAPGTVEVRPASGRPVLVPIDEHGRFVADPVPAGPVSLLVSARPGGGSVVTEWISI